MLREGAGIDDDAAASCARPRRAVGADLREALALDDTLITLKLTPNRADCLSLIGLAREVAAITGTPLDAAGHRRDAGRVRRRAATCASRTPQAARASSRRVDRRHRSEGADAGVDEGSASSAAACARSPRSSTSPTT